MDIWQDRFIERKLVPVGELIKKFNDKNFRIHVERQRAVVEKSHNKLGIVGEVKIARDPETGEEKLYDGHLRVTLGLEKFGAEYEYPASYYAMTMAEADEALVLHDASAAMAEIDVPKLEMAWTAVELDMPELELFFGEEYGLGANGKEPVDVAPQIDKATELQEKWGTKLGQIWQLGDHRLVCGDCTDKAVVEAVMRGERGQSLITDPPFNVRGDEWDTFESDDDFIGFTSLWLALANLYSDTQVCFMADKNVPHLFLAAARSGTPYRRALIWRKPPGSQFAGASLDGFWFDFEILQVFGKPTFSADKQTRMAVLEHRTVTGQEHGAEKPIPLLMDLAKGYSQQGRVVIDFFNGTGSVLAACENLNRQCRGIEISPAYVAVTLQRWQDLTGNEPVLRAG